MRAPDRKRAGAAAGFTLIEMLVGIALLALIMAFMSPLLFEARRALRMAERGNPQAQVSAAQAYLRNTLAQIHPKSMGATGDQGRFGLQGDAAAVTYTTSYAPQSGYQGLYVVTVRLIANASASFDLVADEEMFRPADDQAPPAPRRRLMLLDNVVSAQLAYFNISSSKGTRGWEASWPNATSLPLLVGLDVRLHAADVRRWPTLWVRPAAAGSSGSTCPHRVRCD